MFWQKQSATSGWGEVDILRRFSSRRKRLDHAFLNQRLRGAKAYRRIAGYFRSSIFELVGEEIAQIPTVQVVCNSELDARDVMVAQHARETALKEAWNELAPEVEALLHRDRYRRLYELLTSGRVEIRVVPKDRIFVHGKAGVIVQGDDTRTAFLGSINESKSAFDKNYELVWEDLSEEGVKWVDEEFQALWKDAYPLPDAIIEEIDRVANRVEIRFGDVEDSTLPAAAIAEAPIYRAGEQLQPWQRSFVTTFLRHRKTYGKARLLLADEVGVGKTLSLATSALVSCLLEDGPILILCPATLLLQWQVELDDKLGVPSAVWSSTRKLWIDSHGHKIRGRGLEDIAKCPMQIGIVSTGLVFQESPECEYLVKRKYGVVILDEAHRARGSGTLGKSKKNNLLIFMEKIGHQTKHLLLGTATPFQTQVSQLWDLLGVLNKGADFVLGVENQQGWHNCGDVLPLVKGEHSPSDAREAWDRIRNPLPPANEGALFASLRIDLGLPDDKFFSSRGFGSIGDIAAAGLQNALHPSFFQQNNSVVRHTVLRRRRPLEDAGLIDRIGVNIHPDPDAQPSKYIEVNFNGTALVTNHPFNLAYGAAMEFATVLGKRSRVAAFLSSLLLQRICSSFASGKATASRFLRRELVEDEEPTGDLKGALDTLTPEEHGYLTTIVVELSRQEARDPKIGAVISFLTKQYSGQKNWLEHGCIVFSQYYDTVLALATELTKSMSDEAIGIYAGTGRSRIYRDGDFASVNREAIKSAVRKHEIRLVIATDAACEGLNLQTLGTMINVDLPWNPSRLEQRLGRIKRFGQRRKSVDMLNLVYQNTRDEDVYSALSRRMKDKYDIFGSLPDTIDDDWIDNIENLEEMMDRYIHMRDEARSEFDIRSEQQVDPDKDRWELCAMVLARRDIVDRLSVPW